MNAADLIAALDLPASARVDQRVPKKLLVENGAPTAADKRRINEGLEEVHWLAALKPTTVGVPEFRYTQQRTCGLSALEEPVVEVREPLHPPREREVALDALAALAGQSGSQA